MATTEHGNLRPTSHMTPEERRAFAAKGGRASAAARKKRKALREYMEMLLLCAPGEESEAALGALGVKAADINYACAVNLALLNKCKAGDVAAMKELRSLIGEADSAPADFTLEKAKKLLDGVKNAL